MYYVARRRGEASSLSENHFELRKIHWLLAGFGIEELGQPIAKEQLNRSCGAIAMLGDKDIRDVLLVGLWMLELIPIDEHHDVRILLE